MAGNEKNFRSSIYVDDNAFHWCLRGEDGGRAAVDGHAAFIATNPVFGKITRRRHPRYIVAMNATTFRTIRFIVYTAAAYAAIAGGSSIAVQLPGLATTTPFLVSSKVGEKMPIARRAATWRTSSPPVRFTTKPRCSWGPAGFCLLPVRRR